MRAKLIASLLLAFPAAFLLPAARSQSPVPGIEPRTVRISVLSLFHPHTLTLIATIPVQLDAEPLRLAPRTRITIQATDGDSLQILLPDRTLTASVLTLPQSAFTLEVPDKLTRAYRGALTVTAHNRVLRPIIAMDPELAVASIVQAESPPGARPEALKAQAVASRSFLLANLRAPDSATLAPDACDTTHCQFLRGPPKPDSLAMQATRATAGLVLTWQSEPNASPRILPAMYSRSCGGHTRSRPTHNPDDYPFYSVACAFCLRHPERWSRPNPSQPVPTSEQSRLIWNRTHGWSAIPSLTLTPSGASLDGRGTGHGFGLCQLGAADLAARGQSFTSILAHFYPNTRLTRLPLS